MKKITSLFDRSQVQKNAILKDQILNTTRNKTFLNNQSNIGSKTIRLNKIPSKKIFRKINPKENSLPIRFNQLTTLKENNQNFTISHRPPQYITFSNKINPIRKLPQSFSTTQQTHTAIALGKGKKVDKSSNSMKKRKQNKSLQIKTTFTNNKSLLRFDSQASMAKQNQVKNFSYYISDIKRQFQLFSGQSDSLTLKLAHFLNFMATFRILDAIQIPSKPYKFFRVNSNIKSSSLTVIFDMDQTLVHCSECQQNQFENMVTIVKQRESKNLNMNSFLKFHKQLRISTQGSRNSVDIDNFMDQNLRSQANLQPNLEDFTSDLATFATQTKKHYRVQVRPHAIEMLERLKISGKFSIGLFTSSRQQYADKVIQKIDPQNRIFDFKLYRNHCYQYRNREKDSLDIGEKIHIKDLRILEDRKIEKIVLIDNCPSSMLFQPENGIPIFSFYGFEENLFRANLQEDVELLKLQKFLYRLHSEVSSYYNQDIRVILRKYFQFNSLCKYNQIKDLVSKLY